jgi:hypothetical protein
VPLDPAIGYAMVEFIFFRSFLLVPCPLTYLSTLYVSTIILLILVPMSRRMEKNFPPTHNDLAPREVSRWKTFLGITHSLTYLSTLYVSTKVLLVLVPMYVKRTCRLLTEMTRHCWGPKWGNVAKCWPDIWRHVADMSADTTFGPQNCRH